MVLHNVHGKGGRALGIAVGVVALVLLMAGEAGGGDNYC